MLFFVSPDFLYLCRNVIATTLIDYILLYPVCVSQHAFALRKQYLNLWKMEPGGRLPLKANQDG